MHFLPENSKRRENVIAGLAAALVGVAMIAIAGKASATDPAANARGSHASAAAHRAHDDEAAATQRQDHGRHARSALLELK